MMKLRPYQEEAFEHVFAEWDGGRKKTLIVMPTGTGKTIVRLLSYINKGYMGRFVLAMCCMAVSSVVGVVSSLFLRTVIDDYITPMLKTGSTDFSGLLRMITLMITVYCCGIVTNLVYNLLLVRVSHGVLNRVRREMFDHMQSLPIRYFDTNSYGDIKSFKLLDARDEFVRSYTRNRK